MLLFVLEVRVWNGFSELHHGLHRATFLKALRMSMSHGFLLYAQCQKQCDLSQEVTLKFSYLPFPSLPPLPWHWAHLESSSYYLLSAWLARFFHSPLSSSLTMHHILSDSEDYNVNFLGAGSLFPELKILFLHFVSNNPIAWFQLIISAENSPSIFSS